MFVTEWDVPDGVTGECRVETFVVDEVSSAFSFIQERGRGVTPGRYKRLFVSGQLMMSNTPAEIRDQMTFVRVARRGATVLLHGLGLGVTLARVLESATVRRVTVVEKSADVLAHVGSVFARDPRVELVHDDALTWRPEPGRRWDAVWHDIWPGITSDNLPEMARLHRRFGRRCWYQQSWCRGHCERMREVERRDARYRSVAWR